MNKHFFSQPQCKEPHHIKPRAALVRRLCLLFFLAPLSLAAQHNNLSEFQLPFVQSIKSLNNHLGCATIPFYLTLCLIGGVVYYQSFDQEQKNLISRHWNKFFTSLGDFFFDKKIDKVMRKITKKIKHKKKRNEALQRRGHGQHLFHSC